MCCTFNTEIQHANRRKNNKKHIKCIIIVCINTESINALITIEETICGLFIRKLKKKIPAGIWHIHGRFTMNISRYIYIKESEHASLVGFHESYTLRNLNISSFSQPEDWDFHSRNFNGTHAATLFLSKAHAYSHRYDNISNCW